MALYKLLTGPIIIFQSRAMAILQSFLQWLQQEAMHGLLHIVLQNHFRVFISKVWHFIQKKFGKPVTVTCIEPGFVKTKMAKGNKQFWVVPLEKAARQIIRGIEKKKRKIYISRRWQIIASVMKCMPFWLYRRMV